MTQIDTIRRHPNGSIDLDFYRAGATALRRQAIRESSMAGKAFAGSLAMLGIFGIAIGLAAMPWQAGNMSTAAATHPIYCSYSGTTGAPSMPCWLTHSRGGSQPSMAVRAPSRPAGTL